MKNAIQNGKTRVMLLRHPQGGIEKLGTNELLSVSSVITSHDSCHVTCKI